MFLILLYVSVLMLINCTSRCQSAVLPLPRQVAHPSVATTFGNNGNLIDLRAYHQVSSTSNTKGNNAAVLLPPSPADLLKPDGFQFYAYNEKGDMITRQMTVKEIQALIAAGGPEHISMEIHEPQKADEILSTGNKVMDVVEKVQSVLKSALGKPTTSTGAASISTVPLQVNQEWSNILPAILAGDVELSMTSIDNDHVTPSNTFFGEKYSPPASSSTEAIESIENVTNASLPSSSNLLDNVENKNKSDSQIKPESSDGSADQQAQLTTSVPYHATFVESENVATQKPLKVPAVFEVSSPSRDTSTSTSTSTTTTTTTSLTPTSVAMTMSSAIEKDQGTLVHTESDESFGQTTVALYEMEKVMLPVAVITTERLPSPDEKYVASTVFPTAVNSGESSFSQFTTTFTTQQGEEVSDPAKSSSATVGSNDLPAISTSAILPSAQMGLVSFTGDMDGASVNFTMTPPVVKMNQSTSPIVPTYEESLEMKEEWKVETATTKTAIDSPVNINYQATEFPAVLLSIMETSSEAKRNSSASGASTTTAEANAEQYGPNYLMSISTDTGNLIEVNPIKRRNESKEEGENERPNSYDTISTVEAILRTVTPSTDTAKTTGDVSSPLGVNLVSLLPSHSHYNVQAQTVASNLIAGLLESEVPIATLTPLASRNESLIEQNGGGTVISKAEHFEGNSAAAPAEASHHRQTEMPLSSSEVNEAVTVGDERLTTVAPLEETTKRSSGEALSFEFSSPNPTRLNMTMSSEGLTSDDFTPAVAAGAGGSGGDSKRTSNNQITDFESNKERPALETWVYENNSENAEHIDSMKETSVQNVVDPSRGPPLLEMLEEVHPDRLEASWSSFTRGTPSGDTTIPSVKTKEELLAVAKPVVDGTSDAQEDDKWQLISHKTAAPPSPSPSPPTVLPTSVREPGSDVTMLSIDQSGTKNKNREESDSGNGKDEAEEPMTTNSAPAAALAFETSVESATKWVAGLNLGGNEEFDIKKGEKTEASLMLEVDSTSGAGLDSSTRGTSSDIINFTRLCNEIAFKFWMATNRGLSSGRSLALSPFGMTSLLAMIFLGARGTTSEQMNEVLGLDNVASFNPHLIFQNVTDTVSLARLKEQGVANAAFVREIFADRLKVRKLMPFYKEQAQQFYEGLVAEVNFATISDLVRRRTNLLIRKQTGGRIKDFVRNNAVPLRSPLAAISANVFQTDCNSTLASSVGRDGELYFAVSSAIRLRRLVPVPATVWRTTLLAGYEPTLDATAIALGTSRQLVSTIFLLPGQQGHLAPGDNLDRLEQRLLSGAFQHGSWDKLLKVLVPRPGLELQLPKFTHRSIVNATAALKRIGLDQIFSARADLKGINGVGNHLFFTDVLQMNLFSTCGDEGASNARHHVETYPASPAPRRGQRQKNIRHFTQQSRGGTQTLALEGGNALPLAVTALPESIYLGNSTSASSRFDSPTNTYKKLLGVVPKEAPRLKLDQPFLYFVRHNPTGMILHMGRFNPSFL